MTPLVIFEAASKLHGGKPVLPPTDLCLRQGQIVAVTGPSGVGKSTLRHADLDDFAYAGAPGRQQGGRAGDQRKWKRMGTSTTSAAASRPSGKSCGSTRAMVSSEASCSQRCGAPSGCTE